MESFFKAQGLKGAMLRTQLRKLGLDEGRASDWKPSGLPRAQRSELDVGAIWNADLAWHVRAWGWWVLREVRRELARYYPIYADWQP